MNSNSAKVSCRQSGDGYKRKRKERDAQNKIGAVKLQRFLVPVQLPPQNTGQERVIPDPPLEDNGSVESDIATRSDLDPSETVHEGESDTDPMASENFFQDVGTWPTSIQDALRVEIVHRGPLCLQNKDGPFPLFQNHANISRSMNRSWFYRTLDNGEQLLRSWLVYSPSMNCLQCFCCRLFGNISRAFGTATGFGDWSKLNPRVHAHEDSPGHEKASLQWAELCMGLDKCTTIDAENQKSLNNSASKWRNNLSRIFGCICFLSRQNLAFRGHREALSSTENTRNFLELVNFFGNYDPVVREHLTRFQSQPTLFRIPLQQYRMSLSLFSVYMCWKRSLRKFGRQSSTRSCLIVPQILLITIKCHKD